VGLPDDGAPRGLDAQHIVDLEDVVGRDPVVVDVGDLKDPGQVRALGVDDVALRLLPEDGPLDALDALYFEVLGLELLWERLRRRYGLVN
jgi:hypothetical protein